MELDFLGWNVHLDELKRELKLDEFEIGRVTVEHKERYVVRTAEAEFDAEITGNLRFTASGREDFPAVGDWVAVKIYDGELAIIHSIFPRFSMIKRQAVGQHGEIQIIAANVDYAFLVQAVDRDFNVNRLERYMAICNDSRVSPIILLSKTDTIEDERLKEITDSVIERIKNVPVISISNLTLKGYEAITSIIEKGKTYCLLGSSGVGKSTLINNFSGKILMKTDSISTSTNKGRHVTSHRELIVLDNGGILIDNPGMREVGIADSENGLEITFDKLFELSANCRFADCTHVHESGCAVREAVENGEIDNASYQNYLKMEREKAHFESTIEERRKKDKSFGKMLKNYKKTVKGHKA